jgi:hypothetical protein
MSFSFIDQMEENVRFNLCYPYHIHREKLQKPEPECFPTARHTHSFEMLLKRAYCEPFAFYLTEEDMAAYSAQELEFIARVVAFEQERIQSGQCIVDLNIDDDTMEYLLNYKTTHKLTFEEAVVDILSKIIENPGILSNVKHNDLKGNCNG